MTAILEQIRNILSSLYIPKIQVNDVIEIAIIAFLLYMFMAWIQKTRAYTLLKGILIVGLFIIIAWVMQLSAILWIFQNLA
ncbi:MAG: diadenylate cyclase CdaA, partial [bacterium]